MKRYPIIYLKSELKSFSWNDGLFAIYKEEDGIYHLWKVKENGQPNIYNDGKLDLCCTGTGNKGITKTPLFLEINID